MKPEQIEELSFKIIDQEAGPHDFAQDQWSIVRRMIHTSADFEYQQMIRFHPEAVQAGISAIRAGKSIITDTNMARVGIRKVELEHFGTTVKCYMSDPEIGERARKHGTTRAKAAVEAAVAEMKDGIYVIGNAPTALMRLCELMQTGDANPALVVGLPVGFVNAAESKAVLIEMNHPYISNVGRKGGSNVAASVVNALAKLAALE
jgi:precorrin-8X/cobalt-precorrin-8 methylmutase